MCGLIWDPGDVQRAKEGQFAGLVGEEGARAIHGMMSDADSSSGRGARVGGETGSRAGRHPQRHEASPLPGIVLGVAFLLVVALAISTVLGLASARLGTPSSRRRGRSGAAAGSSRKGRSAHAGGLREG